MPNDPTLTQFSGLAPFIRYLVENLDIVSGLRRTLPPDGKNLVFA